MISQEQVDKKVAEQAAEDSAGRQASAEPMPGPLREAFAIRQDIQVGPHSVRPFYDADFEYLALLGHALQRMMAEAFDNKPDAQGGDHGFKPRGPEAWELAWILTREIQVVDKAFKSGVEHVRQLAKETFGMTCTPAELDMICTAAIKQMDVYWSPVLAYGAREEKPEGSEAANAPANPTPSGRPPTGSAG